jgi:pyruvate,water dikinase
VEARGLSELTASLKEFEDGEILVTTMTQPNMVFLMKRAAAIVTNEGGMVSHAAIVSREFGVPCVVGTRKGTKVLKTGDRVIVDANKGIVKKL